MQIETIGDMRAFIAQFPPEADGYPFIVAEFEGEPMKLDANTATNCDGHPDYAWVNAGEGFE